MESVFGLLDCVPQLPVYRIWEAVQLGYTMTYQISSDHFSLADWRHFLGGFFDTGVYGRAVRNFCSQSDFGRKMSAFSLANRQNRGNYDQIFSLFKSGIYLNVVKIMFLRDLYTFLTEPFSLIIPGVVKSYEYSMIPYILAENPQIDSDRAFAVSRSMTDREKISIFVLDWSFYRMDYTGDHGMRCGYIVCSALYSGNLYGIV